MVMQEHFPAAVDADVMDGAYRVARSVSPAHPGLLVERLRYLMRAQRCGQECDALVALLLSTASRKQEVRPMVRALTGATQ